MSMRYCRHYAADAYYAADTWRRVYAFMMPYVLPCYAIGAMPACFFTMQGGATRFDDFHFSLRHELLLPERVL